MEGEGPTRDLDQILATYRKRLRAPRSGAFTKEFGLKSLAMLGVQGVESYNKTGLEKLLVARLKEVFGGRHKKADVAAMIRYFEKKREQLGVGPGDHLYVSLRGRNPPPSDYFERPAVGRPRAGLTKEAAYGKYAPRENRWLNYFKENFARVKAANPIPAWRQRISCAK